LYLLCQPPKTIAHPITKPFDFLWVDGASEALREIEKFLLFLLFSFDPVFDRFHQHPVGTEGPGLRHSANFHHWCGYDNPLRKPAAPQAILPAASRLTFTLGLRWNNAGWLGI